MSMMMASRWSRIQLKSISMSLLKQCTSGEASGEESLALWLFPGSFRPGLNELLVSSSFSGARLQGPRDLSDLRSLRDSGGLMGLDMLNQFVRNPEEKWNPEETHNHTLFHKLATHLALFTL